MLFRKIRNAGGELHALDRGTSKAVEDDDRLEVVKHSHLTSFLFILFFMDSKPILNLILSYLAFLLT